MGEYLSIRVVNQNGADVHFKIKKTTPLRKLMEAYCNRSSVSLSSVRFLINGERLHTEQTPKDVGLQDRDVIDTVLMQTGG
jgi:small ubiquitin-related modifier